MWALSRQSSGGKATPKNCAACGNPKKGHPKGRCPTHCMKCKQSKGSSHADEKYCQSCQNAVA